MSAHGEAGSGASPFARACAWASVRPPTASGPGVAVEAGSRARSFQQSGLSWLVSSPSHLHPSLCRPPPFAHFPSPYHTHTHTHARARTEIRSPTFTNTPSSIRQPPSCLISSSSSLHTTGQGGERGPPGRSCEARRFPTVPAHRRGSLPEGTAQHLCSHSLHPHSIRTPSPKPPGPLSALQGPGNARQHMDGWCVHTHTHSHSHTHTHTHTHTHSLSLSHTHTLMVCRHQADEDF